MNFVKELARQFELKDWQIEKVIELIDEGNTIPFIARYRKEAHGSLDDQTLRAIADRLEYLRGLEKRRAEVSALIEEAGSMTPEVSAALDAAATLSEIEDIYRPFRPKRKTRGSVARQKGLEPLAAKILLQEKGSPAPEKLAEPFVDPEKGVESVEDAVQGAMDIIAEDLSDDASIRKRLRVVARAQAVLTAKAADPEKESVYEQYYEFSQPAARIAPHRVLAIDRGEREGFLKVSLDLDREKGVRIVESACVREGSPCTAAVRAAAEDSYARLIFPSIEREIRASLTEAAAEQAIKVFAVNLRQLLMQPPVKGRVAMGLDPGYRTGCKVAVVDPTGRVLDTGVIYPTHSKAKAEESARILKGMIQKYGVQVIAIGNGTASRETEQFTAQVLAELHGGTAYMIVNEAGASVYSASKLAAQEFPDFDVTLRSQHDMPQKRLAGALDGVVEDCVNTVGVDLNTASAPLLEKVSGVSAAVAKNIVAYREENGAFQSRAELKKVPKLGPKAFEQCAGFLRVPESGNILDNTAVHPESYAAAEGLLRLCGFGKEDVRENRIGALRERVAAFGEDRAAQELGIGVPTLRDMESELLRPGRDPRDELPPPLLRTDVLEMKDLKPGMELTGTVRNVIDFGAFVDIGVHQDGLVHISQICDRFIRHPGEVLKVGDIVRVWVLSVDLQKKRISLTMKEPKGKDGIV